MTWVRVFLLLSGATTGLAQPQDTLALKSLLQSSRGKESLTSDEYRQIQHMYLAWIDTRVKFGATTQTMNRELRANGLLIAPARNEQLVGYDGNPIGYLEELTTHRVTSPENVFALDARIYRGRYCSLDSTGIIYQSNPVARLASLSAEADKSTVGYYLSGLSISAADASGERLIASGWVVSNCTSTWNGKRIRIDRLSAGSNGTTKQILAQDVSAQDRFDEGENVGATIDGDSVNFRYRGATGDSELLSGPAVARFLVTSDRATRTAPVALTRAGILYEWLRLNDSEVAWWSTPEAMAMRKFSASLIVNKGFQWERIAKCGGSPATWELAVRPNESEQILVFRIGGSKAIELRMLSVSRTTSRACVPVDMDSGMRAVGGELEW
jgi:hypothetical protein